MNVLTGNRQARQIGQQVATQVGQILRVVAADVEHGAGFLHKGIQSHGKQTQLAG